MTTLTKLFANIKNGQRTGKSLIKTPFSKCSIKVLDLLFSEGFICGYGSYSISTNKKLIYVLLKYRHSQPVIKKIEQVSSSGRKIYTNVSTLRSIPSFQYIILSTSKGILSHSKAISLNVGGKILCKVI